ncbi:cathepsin H [Micractinium conductrix]|uniref:Cathepsin H n=1 Tax=Micractinium conductrix TaxID=554055 RepID=A0A2P6VGE7_9CHLO|nr:cathepsin H [Micractinium conductrix]|eukprot:PSC73148.1 cathepsin H [Micractinium conductrix]
MRALLLLGLCALPLAAAMAPVVLPNGLSADEPSGWTICEKLAAADCAAAAACCSLCTRLDGAQLCFTPQTAKKLPDFAFKCTTPGVLDNPVPAPWQVCEMLVGGDCDKTRCQLCTLFDSNKSMCFEPEIAAKLPAAIFTCDGAQPQPPVEPQPEEAAAGAVLSKPAPKVICELKGAAACAADAGECSLCTRVDGKQLCFNPAVAARLSPWAFKCSGALPKPTPMAASRRAGPSDAEPGAACGALGLGKCAAQAGCVECERVDGWKLCFAEAAAAELSPYAYRCPNNDAEPALEAAAAAAPKPAPWTMCESLSAANCTANPACSLCTMPSGKPMCFNDKIAAKLPPAIFKCTKNAEPAEPALDAAAAAAGAPKPAPWAVCDALAATNCTTNPACTLCTLPSGKQHCFNDKSAAKLPPAIFKCSKDAELALEAAAAAAPKPAPWTVCESLSAANCTANPACSLCTMPSSKPMCFNDKIAAKLPPAIFKCTKNAEPAEPALDAAAAAAGAPKPAPWAVCDALAATNCTANPACTLCTLPSGKQHCFNDKSAAKLPPAIFKCSKDAEPALEAAAAAAPKPAPWTVCESLSAANCTANPACSLCTMPSGKLMCFNDKIAAKLPPAIFKCTKDAEPAEPAKPAVVAATAAAPGPAWEPCEALPAANCTATCELCTLPSGKHLCFNPKIAAKLPPAIFHCQKPAVAEA